MAKYFKYQQVDSVTGISVAIEPARNGLKHPDLPELKVITFSKDGVWVYAEAGETAVGNEDNYIYEIEQSEFSFAIKTKIDLIMEERLENLNQVHSEFLAHEIETLPQDPYHDYSANLSTQVANKLKEKIENQLKGFVFDSSDPIESLNQWENKMEILKSNNSELRIPFYSVNFASRWEYFIIEEEARIKENGTDEEKIGLRILPVPAEV